MKRLSLNFKMILIASIPFLAFLGFALKFIGDRYQRSVELSLLGKRMITIDIVSEIINETQKERGLGAAYIEQRLDLQILEAQTKKMILEFLNFPSL